MKNSNVKMMAESALMLALSSMLCMITLFKMPYGGAVTPLSMFPICFISIKYGLKQGLFVGFIYSQIQILLNLGSVFGIGITPKVLIGSIAFDYIAAYSSLGTAGIFGGGSLKKICLGISFSMVLKLFFHFLSGAVFFKEFCPEGENYIIYSFCYNGAYMLPEAVLTVLGAAVIFKYSHIFNKK